LVLHFPLPIPPFLPLVLCDAAAPHAEEGAEADWRPQLPSFQGGWRIPLKAPIELSNIDVFSPEADHREAAAEK
jgi:hypothetical protein